MFPPLIDGKVWVPMRAEGPGGLVGDAMVELPETDPQYPELLEYLTTGNAPPASGCRYSDSDAFHQSAPSESDS
jgi:hypothetical protein